MKTCEGLQELISAYADRELNPKEIKEVEGHMKNCECCKNFLELQYETKKLVRRSIESVKVPKRLKENILNILGSVSNN